VAHQERKKAKNAFTTGKYNVSLLPIKANTVLFPDKLRLWINHESMLT